MVVEVEVEATARRSWLARCCRVDIKSGSGYDSPRRVDSSVSEELDIRGRSYPLILVDGGKRQR